MTAANILATYAHATDQEITEGKRWYDDARTLAANLAHTADHRPSVTLDQAAGVIAALSPLTPWERNKELALRAVTDHAASGTLGNSVRAANAILDGAHPLDVLRADKVRNFYLSILGDPDAVCVDRHAFEVYQATRYRNADRPSIGRKLYRTIADAYRQAAATLDNGTTPAELQAITWVTWRRIHLTGTPYEIHLNLTTTTTTTTTTTN